MRAKSDSELRQFLADNSMPVPEAGCHIWLGALDADGYGQVGFRGKNMRAHRVSYLLNVGPLEPGMVIMHRCDTPACINPKHLLQDTSQANTADRDAKGRHTVARGDQHYMRRTRFIRAGEKAPTAKLTEPKVIEIRRLLSLGIRQADIATQFSVSRTCISGISTKRLWTYLT